MPVYKDHIARTEIQRYVSCIPSRFETAADVDRQKRLE